MNETERQAMIDKLYEEAKLHANMSEASKELLRTNAIGYVATRDKQLRAALLDGDGELIDLIMKDVSAVAGKKNAEDWKIKIAGELVSEEINKKQEEESKPPFFPNSDDID